MLKGNGLRQYVAACESERLQIASQVSQPGIITSAASFTPVKPGSVRQLLDKLKKRGYRR